MSSAKDRMFHIVATEGEDVLIIVEDIVRHALRGDVVGAIRSAWRGTEAIAAIIAVRSPKPQVPR